MLRSGPDLVAILEVGVGRGDGECFSLETALLSTLVRDLGQETDRSVGTRCREVGGGGGEQAHNNPRHEEAVVAGNTNALDLCCETYSSARRASWCCGVSSADVQPACCTAQRGE